MPELRGGGAAPCSSGGAARWIRAVLRCSGFQTVGKRAARPRGPHGQAHPLLVLPVGACRQAGGIQQPAWACQRPCPHCGAARCAEHCQRFSRALPEGGNGHGSGCSCCAGPAMCARTCKSQLRRKSGGALTLWRHAGRRSPFVLALRCSCGSLSSQLAAWPAIISIKKSERGQQKYLGRSEGSGKSGPGKNALRSFAH